MAGAGDYCLRYEWRRNALAAADAAGGKDRQFTAGGYLWGTDPEPTLDAGEDARGNGIRQKTTAAIRLRNLPAVMPRDELYAAEWGETWRVTACRRGADGNEVVATAERYGP